MFKAVVSWGGECPAQAAFGSFIAAARSLRREAETVLVEGGFYPPRQCDALLGEFDGLARRGLPFAFEVDGVTLAVTYAA